MKTKLKCLHAVCVMLFINISAHASTTPSALIDDLLDPIRIFAIFHDDVPSSKKESVVTDHIQPFITEFESITGRKATLVIDQDRPPYSNFNYKNEDALKSLAQWSDLAWKYRSERHNTKEFPVSNNDRFILITNDFINGGPMFGGTAGYAYNPGDSAIASLGSKQAIGHELGHTFNATHEEGEVLYNGWWCETFMFPPLFIRSNCMVFSEGNRKRIKEYVERQYSSTHTNLL